MLDERPFEEVELFDEDGLFEEDVEELFEVVPFEEVEEVLLEDTVELLEGAKIGSFNKEVERLEDVEEPVEDDVGDGEAAFCAAGRDEIAVCSAVEDVDFDPDPVDVLFCDEDWPFASVTGQIVV